jgi:hypothetical protein
LNAWRESTPMDAKTLLKNLMGMAVADRRFTDEEIAFR